ncbi:MAG: 50S ribosomal protein L11 methyltransferase [Alphaproteobacteria bacterium]|nr:MAG: 50S ribosomal protein L11 methyltransferase [Alphaproteobacteria bacterium]
MDIKPNWKLTFKIDQSDLMAIMELLEATFDNEPTSVSGFEDADTGNWYGEALYAARPDEADLEQRLADFQHGPFTIEPLPNIDWVEKSLENLQPVRAGRFYVYAAHNDMTARPEDVPLLIGAGQAFGTGHHGTTSGCLMAIDDLAKTRDIKTALDLGCGTAILAVGLAKVSEAKILASDIDPIAVEVADEVIKDNNVQSRITTLVADGMDDPAFARFGPFDLVIANILARPLIELAADIATQVAAGGNLILSGLLATQVDEVLAAYENQGFREIRRIPLEEWMTLVLER